MPLRPKLLMINDRNIVLRWVNKSSYEEEFDIPAPRDYLTLMQPDFGYPVGFGEGQSW